MINWLIFCSFIASLTLTLLGLIVDISYQVQYVPQLETLQKKQLEQMPSYREDHEFFLKHPVFAIHKPKKTDFNTFFTQIMTQSRGSLVAPSKKTKILALGSEWVEKRNLIEPNPISDQLFAQVHNYDHWNLDPREVEVWGLSATDLIVSGQIYLSNALHFSGEDILLSLEQSRHLSRILLSTEILNFKLAGLSLLEKEQQILDFMNRRQLATRPSWQAVPLHEIKRYRKHLTATASYLTPLTPSKILQEIFLGKEPPVGLCAVYMNKKELLTFSRGFLEPWFPMEPNFSDRLATISTIRERVEEECNPSPPDVKVEFPIIRNLPFYRRMFAMNILLKKSELL